MGGRKKTQKFTVSERAQQSFTVNCSATARNLRKDDLAGVIFGCTHSTYGECLSKKLFGLPAPHYSYVKNIEPGLPLFLFNYSDRKLQGVFEAASFGKLATNSTAWTTHGSENTRYPAQVKIRIRMQCQPLLEDQFKPIIADNYYAPKLFWFELDQAQTNKLISLFSSSPIITGTSLSKKTEKKGAQLKALRAPNAKQECDFGERSASKLGVSNLNPARMGDSTLDSSVGHSYSSAMRNVSTYDAHTTQSNVGWFSWKDPSSREERQRFSCSNNNDVASNHKQDSLYQNLNCDTSFSGVVRCAQKKWSALFKEETCSDVTKEVEEFNPPASEVNPVNVNMFNGEWESPCLQDCLDESREVAKAPLDLEDFGIVASLKPNHEAFCSSLVTESSTSYLHSCLYETSTISQARQESKASEVNLPFSDNFHNEWNSSCMPVALEEEKHHLEVPREENPLELPGEDILLKSDQEGSSFPLVPREIVPTCNQLKNAEICSTNLSFPEVALASEMNSSSIHSTVAKLLFEVGELRSSQFEHVQKVNSLEQMLVESRLEIQQLKDQFRTLENGLVLSCVEGDDL
ncbi:hypothetical protein REPUB_Repub12eG0011500 [Reevesia pubescens]